jgi:DNA-binding MarR family transcriptional regulator
MIAIHPSSNLRKLNRVFNQVRAATHPNVSAAIVQGLIAVALNEGKTVTELAEVLGTNLSTTSRHLLDLGDRNRKMQPGYGLVTSRVDASNLRAKRFTLTPKGRLVVNELLETLGG